MTRDLLAQALRQKQYRVEVEGSGIEALQTAKRVQPDVIVLDVLMRDIDHGSNGRARRAGANIGGG